MKAKNIISFLSLLSAFFVAAQDLNKEKIAVNKKLYIIPSDSIHLLRYEKLLLNEVAKYDFGKNSSGIAIQRRYSPIGQGFIIHGNTNGIVTFRNSHRIFIKEASGSSQFEKPSKTKTLTEIEEKNEEDGAHILIFS